jgi:cytochrome c biogenesis protein CcmG/thiol:disulfide interchange protein DsbE
VSETQINPATAMPSTGRGRMNWPLALVVITVVVGLLALFGYGLIRAAQSGGIGINAIGEVGRIAPGPAPDFHMPLFSGGSFRLSEQQGKLVLVNFWASWCPPCRDEAPVLERAWKRNQTRGVVLVGVDVWDSERDARAFLQEFGITYPNGPDASNAAIEYGLTGVPETFFVRPDGTVARHWIGPLTDAQAQAFVDEMLP